MINQDSAHSFARNRQRPLVCCPSSFRKIARKVEKKKSACKINENDLKIAWKCTLRQSNFKNFPGEAPRTPLMRGTPSYTLPLSRLTSLDTCLRQSMPPRLQTFWVQPCVLCTGQNNLSSRYALVINYFIFPFLHATHLWSHLYQGLLVCS